MSRAFYRPNCINTWRCLGLSFFTSVEEPSFFFLLFFFGRARACLQFFLQKQKQKREEIDGRGAHAVTVTCSFSTHNSGRQIQNEQTAWCSTCRRFRLGWFCFAPQVVRRRCLCLLCLSSYFFFFMAKKKRNLGATVRHEETAHSHTVSCLSRVENDLDKTVNAPVSHVVVMHGIWGWFL